MEADDIEKLFLSVLEDSGQDTDETRLIFSTLVRSTLESSSIYELADVRLPEVLLFLGAALVLVFALALASRRPRLRISRSIGE